MPALTSIHVPGQSTAMNRPSLATTLLIAAGLIAAASAAVAISRGASGDSVSAAAEGVPTAKDWRVVGWAYAEANKPEEAAAAYRRAAAIEPDNAENWSSLGEVLQTASTSIVPEAAAAFDKALKLNPADPRARYFHAVQKELGGDHKAAVDLWLALLRDTPAGAPWEADLRRTIEQTASRNKIELAGRMPAPGAAAGSTATGAIPGPTGEQLAAASSIPPSQQDQMVAAMVERLANRLKTNPRDADGWINLMRSRVVLKEESKAKEALRSGLAAFQGDSATQGRLRSAAAELGIPTT
jgi:cytochrome c-type biogenesis protein CcmH